MAYFQCRRALLTERPIELPLPWGRVSSSRSCQSAETDRAFNT